MKRIAIVGGGFSGTLALVQLIAQAEEPIAIHLIEPAEAGQGIAYSTRDPDHLLNVRADRMGAIAGEPGHFFAWLQSPESAEAREALAANKPLDAESFAPRRLYAAYLHAVLAESLKLTEQKNIVVSFHKTTLQRVSTEGETYRLKLAGGVELLADTTLLAIGNLEAPGAKPYFPGLAEDSPALLPNAWEAAGEVKLAEASSASVAESVIFLLGTGLTAVDTILTLNRLGFAGRIVALSRNGLLPLPHAAQAAYEWSQPPAHLLPLMQAARQAAKKTADWRAVVDGLRPHTVRVWQGFSLPEKQKFLRRLFTLWNIHRHRMAPEIHQGIAAMQASGRLTIISGKLLSATQNGKTASIHFYRHGVEETLTANHVIACTGPGYDIERNPHPLLKTLLQNGLILPHPTHAGARAEGYRLQGKTGEGLFGIGTILLGERLETSAVPELRQQAAEVAAEILKRLQS